VLYAINGTYTIEKGRLILPQRGKDAEVKGRFRDVRIYATR
jgi:hypothetical protein